MKKLIDIPEEEIEGVKIKETLQILAVKEGKDLKNYIQDLLISHAIDNAQK